MNLTRALRRTKRIEDGLREKAFLPILDDINGVLVNQFTLRHLTILFAIGSPFVYGGIRKIEDVGVFMWVVSRAYDPNDVEKRAAFMEELVQHPRWDLFYRAIDRYIYFAFMDRPPIAEGGKMITASYAAAIIHRIALAYHWSRADILDTPVAALFQLLKWIEVYQNPKTPQFTPLKSRVQAKAERIKERVRNGR